jgi:hypothetical protein
LRYSFCPAGKSILANGWIQYRGRVKTTLDNSWGGRKCERIPWLFHRTVGNQLDPLRECRQVNQRGFRQHAQMGFCCQYYPGTTHLMAYRENERRRGEYCCVGYVKKDGGVGAEAEGWESRCRSSVTRKGWAGIIKWGQQELGEEATGVEINNRTKARWLQGYINIWCWEGRGNEWCWCG